VGANVFYDYTGSLQEQVTPLGTAVNVLKKKNDATQQSTYLCIGVALPCGRCLGNIII